MHLLLSLAGVAAIVGGLALVVQGWRDPVVGLSGATLPATVAMTGGFVLLGLSALLTRLQHISDALDAQPVPRPLAAVAAAPDASSPAPAPAAPEPRVDAPRAAANLAAVSKALDIDALASPPAPPPAASPESDATSAPASADWPMVSAADRLAQPDDTPQPASAEDASGAPVVPPPSKAEEAMPAPELARVLKSGVIEGMAYTLYSDGSVDAELLGGTKHFASIAEWRAHLRVGV